MALILDTGPLYASLDRSDEHHAVCRSLIESADEALLIPSPVLVEIDTLIQQRLHSAALVALLADIEDGAYTVENLQYSDYARIRQLCDRHADLGFRFVDAAVLTVAERLNEPKIATLDHQHFNAVTPLHRDVLTLLP